MNLEIENKQIELAEKICNYDAILQFVKKKIAVEDLDKYLDFFKESPDKDIKEFLKNSEPGKVISIFGDEL